MRHVVARVRRQVVVARDGRALPSADRGTPLTRDTFATLSYQGVTGLAFIQLSDEGGTAARLVPNDEVPPRIPLRPGLLSKLTAKGEAILDQVEQITARVNGLLRSSAGPGHSRASAGAARAADQPHHEPACHP